MLEALPVGPLLPSPFIPQIGQDGVGELDWQRQHPLADLPVGEGDTARPRIGVDPQEVSIDEKSAAQARERRHPARPAGLGQPVRPEFECRRDGTASITAALPALLGRSRPDSAVRLGGAFTGV
ncbi:hypothetical protein EYS09_19120 [Streptomyces kasugaensis]|uniref:Uncharacterized protein n=1 Tax=Streptomyces kasugaensis TaxID=1946 RepID=A0A4Q9HSU8_STRKA|nr:hypothetical protein EYS09_19120 [Streptomyces kasugaensis]